DLEPIERGDGLRGVRARIRAGAAELRTAHVLLSNVRVLRDLVATGEVPAEIRHEVAPGPPLAIRRRTLSGDRLELVVEPEGGTRVALGEGGALVLAAPPGGAVLARLTFLQDDPPLTPIPPDELLTEAAADDPRDRRALAFLAYREKLLAGSWRVLAHLGREPLLPVAPPLPAPPPAATEGALGARGA